MPRRTPLPPPPPPEHLRAWPDRESLLADRAFAMAELQRRSLTAGRLALLWALGLVAVLGWVVVSLGIGGFEDRNRDYVTGLVELVLGVLVLAPAVIGTGFVVAGDRAVRRRLHAWTGLAADPAYDRRVRAGARSAVWLGLSVVLCVLGPGLAAVGLLQPDSGGAGELAYLVGSGVIVLVVGLLGAEGAVRHRWWAADVRGPLPVATGGGAHR